MLGEKYAKIERDNLRLLNRLSKILERPHDPTKGTREWGNGVRLDANQVPVIDHCIPEHTDVKGAAVSSSSLSHRRFRIEQERISRENLEIVRRLQQCRPTFDFRRLNEEAVKRERWLANHRSSKLYLLSDPSAVMSSTGRRPGAKNSSTMKNSTARPKIAGMPNPRSGPLRPASVQQDRSRPGSRSQQKVDPAVSKVLDILSSNMAGCETLEQMRDVRDNLMLQHCPLDEKTRVEAVDVGNSHFEIVRAAAVTANDSVVILVHGGMFMTGSPRCVRHLSERLSTELEVPVVVPKLSLAPDHTCPAALDDLARVYDHITMNGCSVSRKGDEGPGAVSRCERVALYAESSGCGLALALLHARSARKEALPCAVVFVSPWVDLTCSQKSFTRNADVDPVLKRGRLQDVSRAYLGGIDPSAESASPLLAPINHFRGLPPTLIHVGTQEVLLDDAVVLAHKYHKAGSEVVLRQWRNVLHSWHVFFPIFPLGVEGLMDAVNFLSPHLDSLRQDVSSH